MTIPGDLLTTDMGVMPHRDVDRALEVALSMDIPFWPQLPLRSYREDMYVQASEGFPGIVLDEDQRKLGFSMDRFVIEADACLAHFEDLSYFDVTAEFSDVYPRFLELDLRDRPAIRGQIEGPVSFGFNVTDQEDRPILFDDTVRPFLFEFMARRVNAQLARLQGMHPGAFMFIDEPGLQFVWSAMSGYGDAAARADLEYFFSLVERPRGVHLCGNPDWGFLLGLDIDVLSLDFYTNAEVFEAQAPAIKAFVERGGVLVWGVVPTGTEDFENENAEALAAGLVATWDRLASRGVDQDLLLSRSMLSPATCCLINRDGEATVEKAFRVTRAVSTQLRTRYGLGEPGGRADAG